MLRRGAVIRCTSLTRRIQRNRINRLSLEHGLPTVSTTRIYAAEGGLMSYGSDFADLFRRGPFYVDRILSQGERAAGRVFVNRRVFVNLKTATIHSFLSEGSSRPREYARSSPPN
jgi:hypothetical protein